MDGGDDIDVEVLKAVLDEREVDHAHASGPDVAGSIVTESELGYGVVVVGVAARHEGVLYSPMVDEMLLNAVTPVVIVRRARGLDRPLPPAFSRAIVPVTVLSEAVLLGVGRSYRYLASMTLANALAVCVATRSALLLRPDASSAWACIVLFFMLRFTTAAARILFTPRGGFR